MSINTQKSRERIKRSTLTGVVPTVPVSSDFTDGTWLNTDIRAGEFFYNIPDEKLWIGTNTVPLELTSSIGNTLADILLNGNTTGASDISVDSGQIIKDTTGNTFLSLEPNLLGLETTTSFGDIRGIQMKNAGYFPLTILAKDGSSNTKAAIGFETQGPTDANIDIIVTDVSNSSAGLNLLLSGTDSNFILLKNSITIASTVLQSGIDLTVTPRDYAAIFKTFDQTTNAYAGLQLGNATQPDVVILRTFDGATNVGELTLSPGYNQFISYNGFIDIFAETDLNLGFKSLFTLYGQYNGIQTNQIVSSDNFATVLTSTNAQTGGMIIGSQNSDINVGVYNSLILGGNNSQILGGNSNIVSGQNNSNITGSGNFISGINNTNNGSSSIISGSFNTINGGDFNIICGNDNTAESTVSSSLLIGAGNYMYHPGIMFGSSIYTTGSIGLSNATGQTANITPVVLTVDGTNAFKVNSTLVYRVELTLLAKEVTTYDAKEWKGFGIIKNVGGTTSLVGGTLTMTSTIGDVSLATATVVVTANNTNDTLDITVTGVASSNIRWNCEIEYILVQ